MKNHEEFRNAVFEKAAAYEKQKKIKRQKAIRIALSLCACLAVFITVIAIPFGIGDLSEAATTVPTYNDSKFTDSETTTEATTRTTAATATTAATTRTTTAAATITTAATTSTTAATTSTVPTPCATTTAATTCTTPAHTYASTTTAAQTTTVIVTTGPVFPEQLLDDYYHNGVMTLHLATSYGYFDDCHIANVDPVFAYSELSEEEAKYFDADFFEENALICIEYALGNIESRLDYAGMQIQDGKITVFLDLEKAQSDSNGKGVKWEILIPIPAELAKDAMIVAEVEEK